MLDLTLPSTILSIKKKYGFVFLKNYGQNFLTDKSVVELAAEAAEVEDGVIEVGPGFGVLTQELAKRSEKVVSFEIDKRLIPVLDDTLSDFDNVKIVNKDILKVDLREIIETEFENKRVSVAANLPYYITTPILTHILESRLPLKSIVVMVQKEVAQRLCASPGTKDYGALTVMCQYYSEPEIIAHVPSSSFMPEPGVDSALVRLKINEKPNVDVEDEEVFFKTVKAAFAHRRKTLENCLAQGFVVEKSKISELLNDCNIQPGIRGERLSLEDFALVSEQLKRVVPSLRGKKEIPDEYIPKKKITDDPKAVRMIEELFDACSADNGDVFLSIGDRLKYYRKKNGYSREEMAAAIGISVSTLVRIEKNDKEALSEMHARVARSLDISLDKLLQSECEDKTEWLRSLFADGVTKKQNDTVTETENDD